MPPATNRNPFLGQKVGFFFKDLKDAFVEILCEVVENAIASMTSSLFPRKACSWLWGRRSKAARFVGKRWNHGFQQRFFFRFSGFQQWWTDFLGMMSIWGVWSLLGFLSGGKPRCAYPFLNIWPLCSLIFGESRTFFNADSHRKMMVMLNHPTKSALLKRSNSRRTIALRDLPNLPRW